jgi:hypothetical protein
MGNSKSDGGAADEAGETELRGTALDGSEQKRAVDHTVYKKGHNPDAVLRVDEEKDTLYTDGLELEDDTPPAGTDGRSGDNAR